MPLYFLIHMKYVKLIILCLFILAGYVSVSADDLSAEGSINSSIIASYSTSNEFKLISETTGYGKNYLGYSYVELGATPFARENSKWAYVQLIWEQKFWNMPLFLHAEVRSTFFNESNSYQGYGGLAYTFPLRCGSLTLETLYRYCTQEGNGGQITIFGAYEWQRINLMHYTDIYKSAKMKTPLTVYNECRLFYKINRRFEVGVIGIISYSFQRSTDVMSAAIAAKINL